MSTFKQSTNALHAGYDPQAHQGAQAVPIKLPLMYLKMQMMLQEDSIFPFLDISIQDLIILPTMS